MHSLCATIDIKPMKYVGDAVLSLLYMTPQAKLGNGSMSFKHKYCHELTNLCMGYP